MTETPVVDILIVSYNTRDDLAACLSSLERCPQGHDRLRVRVRIFDNGSEDGSPEMVAAHHPEAEIVRSQRNLGFAQANNRLVASSDADYVLLLNPDTVLREDIVTPLWRVLESDPQIALAGPRLIYPDGTPQPSTERFPSLRYELARSLQGTKADALLRPWIDFSATIAATREPHLDGGRNPRSAEILWATCWLARTADARRYGPFDEHFTTYEEDFDLCRRLADDGRLSVYVPEAVLTHVGGTSSDPDRKQKLVRAGRWRYYRRHAGLPTALAYRAIVHGADGAKRAMAHRRVR